MIKKRSNAYSNLNVILLQQAARHLKERRARLEIALSMSDTIDENECLVPSLYVGQYARLLELGDTVSLQV